MIVFIGIIFFLMIIFLILVNLGTWGLSSYLILYDLDFLNFIFVLLMSCDWLLFIFDLFLDISSFWVSSDTETISEQSSSPAIVVVRTSLFVGIISIVLFFFNLFIVSFLFLFDVFNDCVSHLAVSGGLTVSSSFFFIFMFFIFNSFFVYFFINMFLSPWLARVNRLKLNFYSLKKQLIS